MTPEQQDPDGRIDALEARVDALSRKLESAHDRIDELESSGGGGSGDGTLDHYDLAALDSLEPGQSTNLHTLRVAYQHAGLRNSSTISERIQHITSTEYFEETKYQTWTFTGGRDE